MIMKTKDSKIVYYVDAEKGVVVAKLSGLFAENRAMIERLTEWEAWDGWMNQGEYGAQMVNFIRQFPDSYVGVAKCYPGDNFDEELGKKIARARLLVKVNNTKAKILYQTRKVMMEAISNIGVIEEHHLMRAKHFEDELEETLGKVEG